MRNLTSVYGARQRRELIKVETSVQSNYEESFILALIVGLMFIGLGLLLLIVFAATDENSAALNYAGIGAVITGFLFFALSAHLLDKFNACRQTKYLPVSSAKFKNTLSNFREMKRRDDWKTNSGARRAA